MNVIRNDEIRFGKPTLKGTRVTVGDIAETFYEAGRSVSQIAEDYSITESEVEEALRYHNSDRSQQEVTA